jgi:hypothetical protein
MSNNKRFVMVMFVLTLVLAACTAQAAGAEDSPGDISHGNEIGGYVELVDSLRSEGARVEPQGSVKQPFFDISGQMILVNGSEVQVFDFGEEEFQQAASEQISPDGSSIGTTMVDWTDRPNFWAEGSLIVIYVGEDQSTMDLLNRVLGEPVMEHAVVGPPDPPYAVIAAEQKLSKELGMPVDEIDFVSFERVEWPDACLGFAEVGEMCAEVLTPGWLVILDAKGQRFEFHTDRNGENLRWKPQTGTGDPGHIGDPDEVTLEGLSVEIDIDPSLATGVTQEIVPAAETGENAPYWAAHPGYLQVSFENYVRENTFHPAQIYVYPVSAFEAVNEAAAERIAALRKILQERPLEAGDDIPFLPLFNAAQAIQGQFGYWAFEGGMGVRFITQYGQGVGPINNHELFYTFQGLTYDGDYYVATILPVSHPDLPADAPNIPEGDWERYVSGVEERLDAASPSSFQPDLTALDQMVRSLTIRSVEAPSPTPQAGASTFECTVFYRPATTAEGQAQSEETTVSLVQHGDDEIITFGDLELQARYSDDAVEGRSLVISVTAQDTERILVQQLYQFIPEAELRDQFAGGHGFTGLTYVHHPTSSAELQYFCQSR